MSVQSSKPETIKSNKQLYALLQSAADAFDIGAFEKVQVDGLINKTTPDAIVAMYVELLRDSPKQGEIFNEKKLLSWIENSFEGDEQKQKRLSYLLMASCRLYPQRSTKAAKSLIKMGADPYAVFLDEPRELGGMRLNMFVKSMSPFAYAVDRGHRQIVKDMFASAKGKRPEKQLVPVGSVCISKPDASLELAQWEPLNQLGYAIACGQTEMFKAMLSELDCTNRKIQQELGQTVHSLLKVGLLDQGPDSVIGNVVTLIGRGADIKPFAPELFGKLMLVDNGMDFVRPQPTDKLAFPAMLMFSTDYLPGATSSDAVSALNSMFKSGLDVEMDVNPARAGAKMMHYAAKSGSTALANALLSHGATGLERDVLGKRPIDYVDVADPRKDMKRLLSGSAAAEFVSEQDEVISVKEQSASKEVVVASERQAKFDRLKARHNALRQ